MTIDAIACNPEIANAIRDVGADYLLAVKGNQPTLQADIEAAFKAAEAEDIEVVPDIDKGHGRIETRIVSVMRQVDWLDGDRRFPGELRFRDASAIVKIDTRTELKDRCRFDARYSITSSARSAAMRGRGLPRPLGNREHAALDARRDFPGGFGAPAQGPRRAQHGAGAKFAINKLRTALNQKNPQTSPPNLAESPKSRPGP